MTPGTLVIVCVAWFVCACIGGTIGRPKGREGAGFLLGLLLGIIGVAIAACLPDSTEVAFTKTEALRRSTTVGPSTFNPGPSTAPAGWYQDGPGLRYFDGRDWTDRVGTIEAKS